MNYAEVDIAVSDDEQAEVLTAFLSDFPFESFASDEGHLRAYIPVAELEGCRSELDRLLGSCGNGDYAIREIATQNWNAAWESCFDPVDVDGRLVIRAPFHTPASEGVEQIVIMPHMSFGTGHHATTCLMASELLDMEVSGLSGLDMGSGTGVLAILAARRGAVTVDAVDIDAWADENCRENARLNGVAERVYPLLGDVDGVADKRYDFILANINRNTLLAHMTRYAAMLRPSGVLLLSGFLACDAPTVETAAATAGLHPSARRERDGWMLVRCVKQ